MNPNTSKPIVETSRLILRNWVAHDRVAFEQHCNTAEVMRFLGGVQTQKELNADVDWFEAKQRDFSTTFWVMERKSDSQFLGFCGLVVIEEGDDHCFKPLVGELEIGWRLRRDEWGNHYALEAAIAVLDYAFDKLRARRVVSRVSKGNAGSWGLMHRLGMRHEFGLDHGEPGPWRTLVYTMKAADRVKCCV